MKNIIYLLLITLISSCKGLKEINNNKHNVTNNLTKLERKIINDFLEAELKKDRYKYYKNQEIVVIEESIKKMKSIDTYLYSLDEWNTMNRINKSEDKNNMYFLDSLQLIKLNRNLTNEDVYHWKVSDFKNKEVILQTYDDFINTTKKDDFIYLPNRLILFLSRPLIIDKNNVFISYECIHKEVVYVSITHFTLLMRKVNNKWKQMGHYEDGVYN